MNRGAILCSEEHMVEQVVFEDELDPFVVTLAHFVAPSLELASEGRLRGECLHAETVGATFWGR